ncbi:MAG TPA: hypothetical protein VNT33_13230, partial [Telluria sp.]|nr:hypothetical protein [Telluria sp.]
MSAFVSGIENLIKAVLPQPVVQGIRAYRHAANIRRYEASVRRRALREWRLMLSNWRKEARAMQARGGAARAHGRILVFPSDPGAVVGSRGDDAMITTVLEATRPPSSGVVVDMFCDAGGDKVVKSMGFNPIPFPSQGDFPAALAGLLRERSYDQYIGVGADIIDSRFGVRIPASMLIAADLAARAGIPATILGSSFSEAPMPQLAAVFRQLDARVHLNIRDPISLRRVVAFAPVQPRLVADAAFLLKPGRADAATVEWIQRQRTMGRRVIGVNAHPMLVPNADASWS